RCTGEFAELFVDDDLHPYSTDGNDRFLWIRGRQLGGRMVAWSGGAIRLTDADFSPRLPDHPRWPVRYSDLAHHYGIAEDALGVQAACAVDEETGKYVSSYTGPWPSSAQRFKDSVETLWPERQVLYRPTSPTHPTSWKGAVRDLPLFRLLDLAERSGHLTLRSQVTVTSVIVDQHTGRASGVVARDSGSGDVLEFRASVILVCASTIETTRLLLNSTSDRHPSGLGNRSGMLGRYLMDHASGVAVTGRRRALGETADYFHPLLIPRYRNVTARSTDFAGGYWWQGFATRSTEHAGPYDYLHLSAFAEVQPRAQNHVRLSDETRDTSGVPVAHISYSLSENEQNMITDMLETGRQMLQAAGYDLVRIVGHYDPSGLSIHEVGTARMGTDPRRSVVNPRNQIWDCENVYVTDGSAFASAGSVNPTLTMLALTARACDDILAVGLDRTTPS
ncbi:MAG: GMC oxidoreductase, partial [Vicinamibacterales bacterium]